LFAAVGDNSGDMGAIFDTAAGVLNPCSLVKLSFELKGAVEAPASLHFCVGWFIVDVSNIISVDLMIDDSPEKIESYQYMVYDSPAISRTYIRNVEQPECQRY
jgi:hypothetical protein